MVTWKVFDAGYTLDQAMTDFAVLEESVVKFLDTYPMDGLMDVGIRNQFTVTEAFGESACQNIGADGWAHSPQKTVSVCKSWS